MEFFGYVCLSMVSMNVVTALAFIAVHSYQTVRGIFVEQRTFGY